MYAGILNKSKLAKVEEGNSDGAVLESTCGRKERVQEEWRPGWGRDGVQSSVCP